MENRAWSPDQDAASVLWAESLSPPKKQRSNAADSTPLRSAAGPAHAWDADAAKKKMTHFPSAKTASYTDSTPSHLHQTQISPPKSPFLTTPFHQKNTQTPLINSSSPHPFQPIHNSTTTRSKKKKRKLSPLLFFCWVCMKSCVFYGSLWLDFWWVALDWDFGIWERKTGDEKETTVVGEEEGGELEKTGRILQVDWIELNWFAPCGVHVRWFDLVACFFNLSMTCKCNANMGWVEVGHLSLVIRTVGGGTHL